MSYIDHVLIPKYSSDKLKICSIMDDCEDNLSDHLPISVSMDITIPTSSQGGMDHSAQNKMFPLTKWDRIEFQQKYAEELSNSLKRIDMININSVTSDEAPEIVNKLYNSLCDTIHDCVRRITTQTQKGKLPRKKNIGGTMSVLLLMIETVFFSVYGKIVVDQTVDTYMTVINMPDAIIAIYVNQRYIATQKEFMLNLINCVMNINLVFFGSVYDP